MAFHSGERPIPSPVRLPRLSIPPALREALPRPGGDLPGEGQRRRAAAAAGLTLLVLLLRPWPPFRSLPGWGVGGLLLWATAEAVLLQWRPRRWR